MCKRDGRQCLLAVERQKRGSRNCIFLEKNLVIKNLVTKTKILVTKKKKDKGLAQRGAGASIQVFLQSWG